MVLKKEKIILKYLTKECKIGDCIDTRDFYDKIDLSPNEVDSVCDALNAMGLLDNYSFFQNGGRSFVITYQIFSYWHSNKNGALRYVIESVIIPIVLGVVSSVVTTLILSALGI